jgi:hypothetical protein
MVLNTGIPVLRKFRLKTLLNITFGEGQVQDPITALPGHGSLLFGEVQVQNPAPPGLGSKISAVRLGDP